ncbi:NOL1/NOP2/sun family putative RNA methylase [Paenibacillus sophorae]|uniref:NOL1/NOP2/sun family putative RNA methylase n=1 Tax=Paenibacillus sophorae TaxID=1333845 RepID=A0A1H8TX85_9BACL|nr:RsmB/NOP family class I SAM-dependent RNA methyltransferase [Paenibacillus sophorae]QWU18079.1 RsmB/NOP family class I SAM-dependent RNA methyltransferase [Paenibacillus sophorae]SEO95632.1 NOL1/NOP2/sun family putative RNA methylase [Paenibacillus sophorae]
MSVQLPHSFSERMKELLGREYEAFTKTYGEIPHTGIRVNTLKIAVDELQRISPYRLEPIPWCSTGFYTIEGARPGKHPYYHAGLYYIQEPSAMAPVELLGVLPGDRVLDLCAAPGGKSTQIAAKLQGQGMLISNDLHPERTKALAKNLELCGARNAVVLNESPERIAAAFPGFFDRILIDAPCSGEGMFRKDEDMVRQWDENTPTKYAGMQREILQAAALALRPGGTLVYSTCTFSPEENEGSIAEFLAGHPQFSVVPAGGTGSFAPGLEPLPGTARLWPHKVKGEGHFIAVLRNNGKPEEEKDEGAGSGNSDKSLTVVPLGERRGQNGEGGRTAVSRKDKSSVGRGDNRNGRNGRASSRNDGRGRSAAITSEGDILASYREFACEQLGWQPEGFPVLFGEHLYLSPLPREALNGLKTVRPGWYMGHVRSGRFIPGHPLATALTSGESLRSLSLAGDEPEAVSYLKGETLSISEDRLTIITGTSLKGYVLVCIDGYSAGWGKWQDGILKNEYPAGWRWT